VPISPSFASECNARLSFDFSPRCQIAEIGRSLANDAQFTTSDLFHTSIRELSKPNVDQTLGAVFTADVFRLRGGSNEDFKIEGSRLIGYHGPSQFIVISKEIEILGQSCFLESPVKIVEFESGSRLMQIEKKCFSQCRLKSLCIPRTVEVLGKRCFAGSGRTKNVVGAITFESESRLIRIEEGCFQYCSLKSICIPRNVEVL
jgi:hypothetical protein